MKNTNIKGKEELKLATREHGSAIINMTEPVFVNWVSSLSLEAQKALLDQHRNNKNFFKGILQEEYRKEHPNSHRYEDSEAKVKKYNKQGKALKEIIDTPKNQVINTKTN